MGYDILCGLCEIKKTDSKAVSRGGAEIRRERHRLNLKSKTENSLRFFWVESLSDLCGSARYKRFIERRSHAEVRRENKNIKASGNLVLSLDNIYLDVKLMQILI